MESYIRNKEIIVWHYVENVLKTISVRLQKIAQPSIKTFEKLSSLS